MDVGTEAIFGSVGSLFPGQRRRREPRWCPGGRREHTGGPGTYALLTDGTTIEIRPARPDDFDAVRDMHAKMSQENLYLRFFSMSPIAATQEARRICREPSPDHAALLGVLAGQVVGCGAYEVAGDGSRSAEVALSVADDMHNRGVGTLLLEHLVSLARGAGIRTLVAETLTDNTLMLQVFANAGLRAHRTLQDGVYDLRFPLAGSERDADFDTYREAVAERERSADVASLGHVLTPASVAVIGVSRGSVGWAVLQNIITGGFAGPVYAVGSGAADHAAAELDGVPGVPSAAALPEPVDLAVIAVPAPDVFGVAEECGRRGVRALAVTTGSLDGAARAELLRICRRHGMRLVGPACSAWPTPLSAWTRRSRPTTLGREWPGWPRSPRAAPARPARAPVPAGRRDLLPGLPGGQGRRVRHRHAAVVGIRPGDEAGRAVPGVVSNPRKFALTARQVGRSIPVLTVSGGRPAASLRRAAIRAAAEVTPQLTRQALLGQAGVIATANLGELLDTAVLLASQPVPAGGKVGVVSNTRGGSVLAADACGEAGLQVASLSGQTQQALRDLLLRAPRWPGRSIPPRGRARPVPAVPGTRRCRPGRGRGPGADGYHRGRRPGSRGGRRAAAGADRRGGDGPS